MMPPGKRLRTQEANSLLDLANQDRTAFHILKDAPSASLASTCFHAQQCIEKTIKAVLVSFQIIFRPTHDLLKLADILTQNQLPLPLPAQELQQLNPCAVTWCYHSTDTPPPSRLVMTAMVETTMQ